MKPYLALTSGVSACIHVWHRLTLSRPRLSLAGDSPAKRRTFWLMLGMSGVLGVLCGLAVVYSIDLPEMEELARYRPNTTTELLDIHGNEIGSFALERRVVVPYTDIPQNLRERDHQH